MAYAFLGSVHRRDYYLGSGEESTEKGIEMTQKALAMDDSIPLAHAILGSLYAAKREYDKAIAEGERSLALDPGEARICDLYAQTLHRVGREEEAILMYQKALRLNPFGSPTIFHSFGNALQATGRFEEAVSAYKKALQLAPNDIFAHLGLASTYSKMGREKEARAEAAEVLRIDPKFSLDNYAKTSLSYKDQSVNDRIVAALRKAGLK